MSEPLPEQPRISVALCTHNGARFIEEQVRSILAQSHPVHELVLGDDDSGDDTVEIVRALLEYTDVELMVRRHSPALGVTGNFVDAIGHTTGDVVFLSDQDDVWHPDKVARMLPALNTAVLAHSDAQLVDAEGGPLDGTLLESLDATGWELDNLTEGDGFAVLLRRNLVTGATVAARGAWIRSCPLPGEGWLHDEWFAMLAALEGGLRLVPEPLIDYRQHGSNVVGAAKLSAWQKLQHVRTPGSGAHTRKAMRAMSLAEIAYDRGLGSQADRRLLVQKARHERTRAALPANPLARIPAIARGLRAGRYRQFSRGPQEAVRDLIER